MSLKVHEKVASGMLLIGHTITIECPSRTVAGLFSLASVVKSVTIFLLILIYFLKNDSLRKQLTCKLNSCLRRENRSNAKFRSSVNRTASIHARREISGLKL